MCWNSSSQIGKGCGKQLKLHDHKVLPEMVNRKLVWSVFREKNHGKIENNKVCLVVKFSIFRKMSKIYKTCSNVVFTFQKLEKFRKL